MYNQTILLGIIVSMLFTEITGYSAGMIVPGYLALNLHSPLRLLYTLALAAAAVGICKLLSRVMILYGRRRFVLLMLLTFALSSAVGALGVVPVSVVGVVLPGLIAREFDRQGFVSTLLSLVVTTGFTALILVLCGHSILL